MSETLKLDVEAGGESEAPLAPAAAAQLRADFRAMRGARLFVTVVFAVLGAAFVAETALLIYEFRALDWPALMLLHPHLFVFFPTFGILALVAFHLPATVFTHMYWNHIPNGTLRFSLGTIVVAIVAIITSLRVGAANPGELWQIAPMVLAQDRAEPLPCVSAERPCQRVALLDGLTKLRVAAQQRVGVSPFARACKTDDMMEDQPEFSAQRYCFASDTKVSGTACCAAQARYRSRVSVLSKTPTARSLTDLADHVVLPMQSFFVIVVVIIGVLLILWRHLLEEKYAVIAPAIERALVIGAAAMIPWPFMDYAYVQAMQTLSGRETTLIEPRLSLVVVPWALLLLVFFLQRMGRKIERLGQLAGAAASIVAVLRYEQLNDVAVRYLGIGAPLWMAPVLIGLVIGGMLALRWPKHLQRAINGFVGRAPDVGMGPPPGFSR